MEADDQEDSRERRSDLKSKPRKGHYVYLYRDRNGAPLYVGYGTQAGRANAHNAGNSHNAGLHGHVARDAGVSIEIVGPFGSEKLAKMVETVLISAMRTRHNVHPGMSEWRLRPFGVPPQFVDRRDTLLTYQDLRATATQHGGLLLVYVNSQDFDDGRQGYDLATPPSDDVIATRVDRWWQLAKQSRKWTDGTELGPRYLLGLSGPPGARFIVASCKIADWRRSGVETPGGGLIRVPLVATPKLDALKFRGVRVSNSPDLHFGSFRHQQYILIGKDGERWGGAKRS
jgi:hypothetical protein